MSGIVKGIKKVFKKVVKVVKKIAPYVILAAAVYFTGGAALGGLGALAGAGPIAGGGLAAGSGVVIGGGAMAGSAGSGGLIAALGSLGGGGGLLSGMGSGIVGSLLSGAASGFMQGEQAEDERKEARKVVQQRQNNLRIDDASLFGVGPQASASISNTGLGIQPADLTRTLSAQSLQPLDPAGTLAPTGPERPTVLAQAPRQPKYRYNPETGIIDYA